MLSSIITGIINSLLQNVLGYFKEQQAKRNEWLAASRSIQLKDTVEVTKAEKEINAPVILTINTPEELANFLRSLK